MADPKPIQAHCNSCGGSRDHILLKKVRRTWEDDRYSVWSETEYCLLECAGCHDVRLRHRSWFSEETDENGQPLLKENYYPPAIFRPEPKWLYLLDREWHVTKLLRQIYNALQNNAPALAAMGLRAVIESIMTERVGDSGSFTGNLKEFQTKGYISAGQLKVLEAALEVGHASIHRGHIPSDFELETALDIMENLIHGLEILEHRAEASIRSLSGRNKWK